MTRNELIDLGELYCEERPGSYVTDVDEVNNTITTYFCGALLTSDADKVKQKLGIKISEEKIA